MNTNQQKGEIPLSIPPELTQQFPQFCAGDLTPSQAQATQKVLTRTIGKHDFLAFGDDSWMGWS